MVSVGKKSPLEAGLFSTGFGKESEAIEVHHLVPSRNEITDKPGFSITGTVDLGKGAELGI